MALGAGSLFYTPPPKARLLAASGSTLPMWIASECDYVILPENQREWALSAAGKYGLARPWQGEAVDEVVPWGWSVATRNRLLAEGVPPEVLPSDEYLETVRLLSHRRLTVKAHEFLSTGLSPVECFTLEECAACRSIWGNVIGKYPWSSTGRGIFSGEPGYETSFLKRCRGAFNHQGSVMIEKYFDVVKDFAMLYYSDGKGNVEFRGLSLFVTNNRAYVANIIRPVNEIFDELATLVGIEALHEAREGMLGFLSAECSGVYTGWIGVDMFIFREESSYKLNPCVEINMRLTMGVVADIIYRRFLPEGFHGRLQVDLTSKSADEKSCHMRLNPPALPFSFTIAGSR